MATSAEQVSASVNQIAASIKSVSGDTDALVASVNESAAAIEEMTRSIQGIAANADDLTAAAEERSVVGGNESVLVVEDDDSVRALVSRILARDRYRVLEAPGPEEALAELEARADPVSLVLCDVVMPKMSGPELAERMSTVQPGLEIVFMSGYTDDFVVGLGDAGVPLLKKPFTVAGLLSAVEQALTVRAGRARA
jgi:CheY-like chemotaxis protein